MAIGAIQDQTPLLAAPSLTGRMAQSQSDFASILGIAERGAHGEAECDADRAREAAQELVASVLVQPTLAVERESDDLPPPFGPGEAEKQFGALIDAQRAIGLVRSTHWPLVDRLVEDMTRAKATGEKSRQPGSGGGSLHGLAPVAREERGNASPVGGG
ncbi:MAG: hypothetical protein H6810_07825 [Phycisphaeraceae bacterium]|nr:MAG: hypothetical protein H6810_07825 [Phycisphaeraceae bacterium]